MWKLLRPQTPVTGRPPPSFAERLPLPRGSPSESSCSKARSSWHSCARGASPRPRLRRGPSLKEPVLMRQGLRPPRVPRPSPHSVLGSSQRRPPVGQVSGGPELPTPLWAWSAGSGLWLMIGDEASGRKGFLHQVSGCGALMVLVSREGAPTCPCPSGVVQRASAMHSGRDQPSGCSLAQPSKLSKDRCSKNW